jgi:transcription antitermination factor NusG
MRLWYVVKSNPRREDEVAMLLSIASEGRVATYLPKMNGRSTKGRPAGRLQPLFPGYIFVRFEIESGDYVLVRHSPGVAYVLGCGGIPTSVPEELVSAIARRLEDSFIPPELRFSPGDRVVITEGPLKDVEAVFDRRLSPLGRVAVLLKIVGRYAQVQIDESKLVKAV